jgi:hypothetical protein
MFQLDQAIEEWKRVYGSNEAVSESAAKELESHLLDSIDRLCEGGLSKEEAFMVASHRLGKPAHLHAEYSKVHRSHIWLSRTILMLSGYLVISLILKFVAFDQAAAGLIGLMLGWDTTGIPISTVIFNQHFHHHWSALFAAAAGLIGMGVMVWLVMLFSRGPERTTLKLNRVFENKLFGSSGKAPRSFGWLVFWWAVLYAVLTVGKMLLTVASVRYCPPNEYAMYATSLTVYNHGYHFITIIVLLMVTAVLHRRYRNLSGFLKKANS